jgi:hypothetical protein
MFLTNDNSSNISQNDVALIRLQYPLEYSTYVQNIELGENIPPAGSPVTCGGNHQL